MKKRLFIFSGLLLISFSALWYFVIEPRLNPRLPEGWHWEAEFIGELTLPDEKTSRFPEESVPSVYIRTARIVDPPAATEIKPGQLLIEDSFIIVNPVNGEYLWEYIYRALVDSETGMHLTPEYTGDIYVFPRNTEKKTYRYRSNYVEGIPLEFMREEKIGDLHTFLFGYKGRGEYTESYEGSDKYPGVPVAAGEEIKCGDDQFIFKAWVEPVTGEIIKLEESCYSGDYIYKTATGRQIAPVMRWGGATAGDDVIHRTEAISRERLNILLKTRYIHALMFVAGLACLSISILLHKVNQ